MAEVDLKIDMKYVLDFLNKVAKSDEKKLIKSIQNEAKQEVERLTRWMKKSSEEAATISKVDHENKKLKEKIKLLEDKLALMDLDSNTLGAVASSKLCEDNPNIADLSDAFRPTRLAEQFRELYDNEWTDAFTVLEKLIRTEEITIDLLANIIKEADKFCADAFVQQTENMTLYAVDDMINPKLRWHATKHPFVATNRSELDHNQTDVVRRRIKELQKTLAVVSARPLAEIFEKLRMASLTNPYKINRSEQLDAYVLKAVTLIWLMKVQTPPVELLWPEVGSPFDKTNFTFYTKPGSRVAQCVWPAVLLTKDGPLMAKGIAQGKS